MEGVYKDISIYYLGRLVEESDRCEAMVAKRVKFVGVVSGPDIVAF